MNQSIKPVSGFSFEANPKAKVLILGSMPGIKSLNEQKYYAHPRNAFWSIMEELFTIHLDKTQNTSFYEKRLQVLKSEGVALWDVLASCERKGSLDSNIDTKSMVLNDFAKLFAYAPDISTIIFNGKAAEKIFRQSFLPNNKDLLAGKALISLPSTSPAYAAMNLQDKKLAWKIIRDFLK